MKNTNIFIILRTDLKYQTYQYQQYQRGNVYNDDKKVTVAIIPGRIDSVISNTNKFESKNDNDISNFVKDTLEDKTSTDTLLAEFQPGIIHAKNTEISKKNLSWSSKRDAKIMITLM